jgi:outer membrane protein assembly factor BamA
VRGWAGSIIAAIVASSARAVAADATDDGPSTTPRVVPIVGGNTDQGVGGGILGSLAREEPEARPYRWRIQASAVVLFATVAGRTHPRYQDYQLEWIVPELATVRRLRLAIKASLTDERLWWYGIGNASRFEPTWRRFDPETERDAYLAAREAWQYRRTHANFELRTRNRLAGDAYLRFVHVVTWNRVQAGEDSTLIRDVTQGPQDVRQRLRGLGEYLVYTFEPAFVVDSRNDEVDPTKGLFAEASVRIAPGGTRPFPFAYGGANATVRGFLPIAGDVVTLAVRGVADVLFGQAPFWELPRAGREYALGGPRGVRGVPAQRYAGMRKAFGNVEVRTRLGVVRPFGAKLGIGVVAFVDVGRVWSDWSRTPSLDGDGIGLKYGVGGGLRVRWGESFVVRFDAAWSPDARPVGVYFDAGHAF